MTCRPWRRCAPLFTALVFVSNLFAQARYDVLEVPMLDGASSCAVRAINNYGIVVGECHYGLSSQAFVYYEGKVYQLIGGWHTNQARAVSDQGLVAGAGKHLSSDPLHAFIFGETPIDLGTLGGNESEALGINEINQVVGYAHNASGRRRAFLYAEEQMQDLGTLSGKNAESAATAINNAGQIVGWSDVGAFFQHAFLYENGEMIDLGTLGGGPYDYSDATAINDQGQITGSSTNADGESHAFRYSAGVMIDLGTLGGFSSSGKGINASGHVVGMAELEPHLDHPEFHAFIFRDRKMEDLNDLIPKDSGWELNSAIDINDNGWIIGFGHRQGESRRFLLIPIE